MPTQTMGEVKKDADELEGRESPQDICLSEDHKMSKSERRAAIRNYTAFWLLGLLNNASYVVMMAVAKDILPGAVGVVFFVNVFPAMFIKVSGPYWFDLVPYGVRVWLAAILMVLSFVFVGFGRSPGLQLVGVAMSALQGGLGEASFLALAAFYDTPRALTSWSSGTGMSGIFGYAWIFVVNVAMGFPVRVAVNLGCSFAVAWLLVYFVLLRRPDNFYRKGCVSRDRVPDTGWGSTRYSTLTSPQSQPSPTAGTASKNRFRNGSSIQGEYWDDIYFTSPLDGHSSDDKHKSRALNMSAKDRLRFTLGLWPYMVPLMLVYFAEYTMQTGTWSSIGFPITSVDARRTFYVYANWSYQGGVFVSRSSGTVMRLTMLDLWILPIVQLLMVLFFYLVAVYHFWYDNSLLILCFGVGLIGGLGYVNAFRLVAEAVPAELKELALMSASVGDSFGVMTSDIAGTFLQAYIYRRNGISD